MKSFLRIKDEESGEDVLIDPNAISTVIPYGKDNCLFTLSVGSKDVIMSHTSLPALQHYLELYRSKR